MHPTNFDGVKVLITGHTGFKGAWLSRILNGLEAEVFGLALKPEGNSLFLRASEIKFSKSKYIDINNRKETSKFIRKCNPDILIHMAAQPLVRRSYLQPIETFGTNVMGTAHVLNASFDCPDLKGVVAVTTDKVYRNVEKSDGYHEDEPLGGEDPYSASKSGSEMVVTAWRNLSAIKSGPKIVTARSGNVIGGGDHAADRLLPDLIRGFFSNKKVEIRNPDSLRPWQHVLDPLFGYLSIASSLLNQSGLLDAFNFGPDEKSKLRVSEMADFACSYWPKSQGWKYVPNGEDLPESNLLWLSSERAKKELGWRNKLDAKEAIKWTIDWELMARDKGALAALDNQIERYSKL
jgi:CDP-glucose 4,6-dehydratase